jgi:hypothetical protein
MASCKSVPGLYGCRRATVFCSVFIGIRPLAVPYFLPRDLNLGKATDYRFFGEKWFKLEHRRKHDIPDRSF